MAWCCSGPTSEELRSVVNAKLGRAATSAAAAQLLENMRRQGACTLHDVAAGPHGAVVHCQAPMAMSKICPLVAPGC